MTDLSNERHLAQVSLDDKYTLMEGRAFLSGMQALVRLPLMLHERAVRAGLKVGGYISGYRGSPVGTYDLALWAAEEHLKPRNIKFQPGVNEELAATAVWGSQQVKLIGESNYDGVFGIWYGKAPGVDRTLDVFRHANNAGTSPHGGVIAIAGDDPNAVSSTVTGCSDYDFVSVGIPLLYPATVQEYLDFGVIGIEMSRNSGCWVGFKAVTDIAESSAIVDLSPDRVTIPQLPAPNVDIHIRWPDSRTVQEQRLYEVKLPLAKTFAAKAGINRVTSNPAGARIGIVSAGKPWLDLLQALHDLGLEGELERHGIRLLKLGMIYPLEETGIREFARGLDTLLVVEEKRGFIEDQIKSILFREAERPAVIGKAAADGRPLIPEHGDVNPALLANVLASVFPQLVGGARAQACLALLAAKDTEAKAATPVAARSPYFCSGCPHNSSTKIPEGSVALAGIGCHWLAMFMDRNTQTFSQMGGEGAAWLGAGDFSKMTHVFANLGDGTYHHSGVMAIRAAIYAKANMTYKLLYNDAVAMTGGQLISDTFAPQQIVAQMLAEGVREVVVVSDHPEKYKELPAPNGGFPAGVTIHGRDELDAVQRRLREVPGVTALLYDQTCAAEKRRRRKRGKMVDPDVRAFINEEVCEGCGDCSVQSNCISVEPLETELGRKRVINQSACNKDLKCVDGFCPSFVTIEGATPRRAEKKAAPKPEAPAIDLPEPAIASLESPHETVIAGIGGTGVITIGAILAMAARLEGLGATCLDQTGIAQKNGAVLSHVRISRDADSLHAPRVSTGNANLVLACDMMVAASPAARATMREHRTKVVLNTHLAPNANFVLNPVGASFGEDGMRAAIAGSAGEEGVNAVPATQIATQLLGDAIATNMFMLGYALQKGWLPVSLAAIRRAIEINAVAVKANLAALDSGRTAAVDLAAVQRAAAPAQAVKFVKSVDLPLGDLIASRRARLVGYQDEAYAARYEKLVRVVQQAEQKTGAGKQTFTRAVAMNAYKLMAYKDEYEVARLYSGGEFERSVRAQFDGELKLSFHLAPPIFSRRDPVTGHLIKRKFGAWMMPAFRMLAGLKGLRGGALDLFGHSPERRDERLLVELYSGLVEQLVTKLDTVGYDKALALAKVPEVIRGFGHVKERGMREAYAQWTALSCGTAVESLLAGYIARSALPRPAPVTGGALVGG